MAYVKVGGAFFEQTAGGLAAVSDRSTLQKLQSGQLTATEQATIAGGANRFASTPASSPLAAGKAPSLPSLPNENPTSAFGSLSAALDTAISLAREKRQSKELDFLDGVVQPGSVSARTFTGLLGDLNKASDNFTGNLTGTVMDFAKAEQERIADERMQIRELALSLVESGADQTTINGILELSKSDNPNVDAAISMASGALKNNSQYDQIFSTSNGIVGVNKDGTAKLIYGTGGGGGGGGTGFFKSGGVQISNADLGELSAGLEASRGSDNYVNTQIYLDAFNKVVQSGGIAEDFINRFPPQLYLNPNDPTVPDFIKNKLPKSGGDDLFENL